MLCTNICLSEVISFECIFDHVLQQNKLRFKWTSVYIKMRHIDACYRHAVLIVKCWQKVGPLSEAVQRCKGEWYDASLWSECLQIVGGMRNRQIKATAPRWRKQHTKKCGGDNAILYFKQLWFPKIKHTSVCVFVLVSVPYGRRFK